MLSHDWRSFWLHAVASESTTGFLEFICTALEVVRRDKLLIKVVSYSRIVFWSLYHGHESVYVESRNVMSEMSQIVQKKSARETGLLVIKKQPLFLLRVFLRSQRKYMPKTQEFIAPTYQISYLFNSPIHRHIWHMHRLELSAHRYIDQLASIARTGSRSTRTKIGSYWRH